MDTITSRTVFGNGDKREGTKDFRSKSEDELYAFGGNQSKEKIIEKNLDESGREAELPTTDLPPFKILRQNIIPVHKHGEKSRLPELVVNQKVHIQGTKEMAVWFVKNAAVWNGRPFNLKENLIFIDTDSSTTSFGCTHNGEKMLQERWSPQEESEHINTKELMVIQELWKLG